MFPLDAELNLPPDKYSHELRKRAVIEVSNNSFDETVDSLIRNTGGKIPKRQAEQVAVDVSQYYVEFYEQRRMEDLRNGGEAKQKESILALSCDAKGIVMKMEDLRKETQRAAKRAGANSKRRLSAGEKKNRKRMAMAAAVYDVAHHWRTADNVIGLKKGEGPKPRAENKRVWASVEREAGIVIDELFEDALDRDPENSREWVVLIDGNRDQLNRIRKCVKKHDVNAVLVLDYIHMLEYLWKASFSFFKSGSDEAEEWVVEKGYEILKGNVSLVAAGMRRKATCLNLSKKRRKAVDKCADYLLKYKDLMVYDQCLLKGYPMASGVIEGACRHLVKDRMDITGARWRLKCAEAVLKLRSLRSSGDFEEYWEFYKSKSLQENHRSKYEKPGLAIAA